MNDLSLCRMRLHPTNKIKKFHLILDRMCPGLRQTITLKDPFCFATGKVVNFLPCFFYDNNKLMFNKFSLFAIVLNLFGTQHKFSSGLHDFETHDYGCRRCSVLLK